MPHLMPVRLHPTPIFLDELIKNRTLGDPNQIAVQSAPQLVQADHDTSTTIAQCGEATIAPTIPIDRPTLEQNTEHGEAADLHPHVLHPDGDTSSICNVVVDEDQYVLVTFKEGRGLSLCNGEMPVS